MKTFDLTPEEYGFKRATIREIEGGNARRNGQIVRHVLEGKKGPKRDMVLLNAAAAFVVTGLDQDMQSGMARASHVIDAGQALHKLDRLVAFTQECAPLQLRAM